ncbi:MAG: hypothetical protein ACYTG6_17245 [Planctomycetota bacterium]
MAILLAVLIAINLGFILGAWWQSRPAEASDGMRSPWHSQRFPLTPALVTARSVERLYRPSREPRGEEAAPTTLEGDPVRPVLAEWARRMKERAPARVEQIQSSWSFASGLGRQSYWN